MLLHFGAVDYRASVWVDGCLVATHEGGNTPFAADITAVLRRAVENSANGALPTHTVVVRAEDRPPDASQPRGKQDWQLTPHKIWYHRTTGIWQPVWLEPVPDIHITDLAWTPEPEHGRVRLGVELSAPPPRPVSLRVTLLLEEEVVAEQTSRIVGDRATLDLTIGPWPKVRTGGACSGPRSTRISFAPLSPWSTVTAATPTRSAATSDCGRPGSGWDTSC